VLSKTTWSIRWKSLTEYGGWPTQVFHLHSPTTEGAPSFCVLCGRVGEHKSQTSAFQLTDESCAITAEFYTRP